MDNKISVYKKDYADLEDWEKDKLDTARQVLSDGNRLYGDSKDDVSHIEYAIGLALSSLDNLYEGDSIATVVEIGIDDDGHFVTFIMNKDTSIEDQA